MLIISSNFDAAEWIKGGKHNSKIGNISSFLMDNFISKMRKYSKKISNALSLKMKNKDRIEKEIGEQEKKIASDSPAVDRKYLVATIKQHQKSLDTIKADIASLQKAKEAVKAVLPSRQSSRNTTKEAHQSKKSKYEDPTDEDEDDGTFPADFNMEP